jgi:hypothetical protein
MVERLEEAAKVQVDCFEFLDGILIAHIAPGIGEGFFLRFGIVQVYSLKEHIVVAFAIEWRVDIHEVDVTLRVAGYELLEYVEAIAEV